MKKTNVIFLFGSLFLLVAALCLAESYLGYDEVKFFEDPEKKAPKEGIPQEKDKTESMWTEPIVSPTGQIFYYTPPKAVLEFVENPTKENAKAYLAWNQKRLTAYAKAQAVMEEVMREETAKNSTKTKSRTISKKQIPKSKAEIQVVPKAGLPKSKMLYFIDPACKYCREELPIINAFYSRHKKEIDIEGITKADNIVELNKKFAFPVRKDRGEIKQFGITTYPTMIFSMSNGEMFGIKGFAQKDVLENIWNENQGK